MPVWPLLSLVAISSCESVLVVEYSWMWYWTPCSLTFLGKLQKSKKVGEGRRGSGQWHLAVQALAAHTHLQVLETCQVWQLVLRNWVQKMGRKRNGR